MGNMNFNKTLNTIIDILPINYKDNNGNIIKGLISFEFKERNEITINNFYIEYSSNCDYNYYPKITNKRFYIIIYGNNLNEIDSLDVYLKIPYITFLNLNYNQSNNMLLIFLNDNIFQISLKTKQIITNYIISPLYFLKKGKNISGNIFNKFKVLSTHNYNEKTKKYEEIILLKEYFENKVYLYYWDDKTLLEKKKNLNYLYLEI